MDWIYLSIAIFAEVIATLSLKFSEGFTRFWPSLVVVIGYAIAFYFLSLALKTMPVGVAYAVWSGVGILLISLLGWILLGQHLHTTAFIGIGLILAGVIVLNIFSTVH